MANSLSSIIAQGQIVGTNPQQSSLVQMVLDGIPSAVEANNLQYSGALQNTLLDIYNTILTSDTFRYDSRHHLKYCNQSSVIVIDTRVSFSLHYSNLATLYSLVVLVLEQTGKATNII